MKKKGEGAIVFIASDFAQVMVPYRVISPPSLVTPIGVFISFPPDTDTPMLTKETSSASLIGADLSAFLNYSGSVFKPEMIAVQIWNGVASGRHQIHHGFSGFILTTLCSGMSPVWCVWDCIVQVCSVEECIVQVSSVVCCAGVECVVCCAGVKCGCCAGVECGVLCRCGVCGVLCRYGGGVLCRCQVWGVVQVSSGVLCRCRVVCCAGVEWCVVQVSSGVLCRCQVVCCASVECGVCCAGVELVSCVVQVWSVVWSAGVECASDCEM